MDLLETADGYVITMEVPGLTQEDVQIRFQDGRLSVSGARRERGPTSGQYHRIERGHGSFARSFQLPLPIDTDRVSADLRDGVLTVTCPKSPDGPARRIRIT